MIKFGPLRVRDFKVIERAEVNLADRGLVLIQGRNRDTDAATSNGSGKTTLIFEALPWCLFGEIIGAGRLGDVVIRHGADKAIVSQEFSDDEHTYVVTRKRTPKTSSLELTTDGMQTNGRTQADTEARVREILGLDWQAFRNTVLHGQGDHERFADRSVGDADRKAILKKILRLERFDEALEAVRDARKGIAREVAYANQERARLEGARSQATANLRRLERLSSEWEERHTRALRDAERAVAEGDGITKDDRKLAAQLERLRALKGTLEVKVAETRPLLEAPTAARADVTKKRAVRDRLKHQQAPALRELERARAELAKAEDAVDRGVCPTCGEPLPAEGDGHVAAVEDLAARVTERDGELERIGRELAAAELAVEEVEEKLEAAEDAAEGAKKWPAELDRIKKLHDEARFADLRIQNAQARRDERQNAHDRIAAETNPNADELHDAFVKLDEIATELTDVEAGAAAASAKDAPLKFWEAAFSNRGLPSLALDTVVPMISVAANRYLQILADGDLTVEVATTTELKGGTTKEAIDLRFVVEGTPDVIPSGGQWRKFGLAIDLALMDLVAAREGAQLDLLLLDEVLDGLDAEGRARVVTLLRALRETRSSVFVVSHDPEIAEHFEKVITVTKTDGAAVVEES